MVQRHMFYSPERKKTAVIIRTPAITLFKKIGTIKWLLSAHSVRADPPPSRPNGLFLLILFHVAPAFAGSQLPIFPTLGRAGSSFTPSPPLTPFLSGSRQ
jgi:hypothetical protein